MATPYLAITDGTTTCTIITTAGAVGDYALDSWTPAVAGLQSNQLTSRGQYENVAEEMKLTILDTTAAGCYTRLNTLNNLLDQAERWYLGENVSPVLVKYAPAGSSVSSDSTPLQAAILGRASGNETSGVGLYPDFDSVQFTYKLPITLRFTRRGLWLLSTTSDDSAATNNGSLATCDFGAALTVVGPTKIDMSNYLSGEDDEGFLLISSNDTDNRIAVDDPSGGTATGWTSVDDSANRAQFTTVLRYTPSATTESTSGTINTTSLAGPSLFHVFANVRNNSATTAFYMRIAALNGGGTITVYTPNVYIGPYSGAAAPGWKFIGAVYMSGVSVTNMKVLATATAASGTLDISAIATINVTYPGSYVLAYKPNTANGVTKNVVIDHALLTKPQPTTLGTYPMDVKGDMVIMTKAQNVVIANLIVNASADDWRQYSGGVVQNTFSGTRYTAYITPR